MKDELITLAVAAAVAVTATFLNLIIIKFLFP